jgi:hypothetical protein
MEYQSEAVLDKEKTSNFKKDHGMKFKKNQNARILSMQIQDSSFQSKKEEGTAEVRES